MALAVAFVDTWPLELRDAAERVLAALQQELGSELPAGTVNLKLVDDAEMLELNKQYSGVAEPTDVLTFHYAEDGELADEELADIAISLDTAQRQASAAGTSLADEIGLLAAHGLLHATGRDHQTPDERERVEELQRRLLATANLNYREFPWKD